MRIFESREEREEREQQERLEDCKKRCENVESKPVATDEELENLRRRGLLR